MVPPRLDPYRRLLSRFYEMLFLLTALGQTRGEFTAMPRSASDVQSRRRRLLHNLAFICDLETGGKSCTALGLQDDEACYRLCIATNGEVEPTTVDFLREVLDSLKAIPTVSSTDALDIYQRLLKKCITFSELRVEDHQTRLRGVIEEAQSKLKACETPDSSKLLNWLSSWKVSDDHVTLCCQAYVASKSTKMSFITSRARNEECMSPPPSERGPFGKIRHSIGRLAQYVRSCKELVADSWELAQIVESIEIEPIQPLACAPPPVSDGLTNLTGVLNRMFRNADPERDHFEELLHIRNRLIDSKFFWKFLVKPYQKSKRRKLQVHAEIQVLEHFYRNKLHFVDGDRYVACSKPACTCCMLYFKHHPANMVLPQSHQKVWINWAPPLVQDFRPKTDAESGLIRDVLNKMTQNIRDDIKAEVLQCYVPPTRHPDSQTGFS